ncbi:MAG: S46 family peptidase [Saprospiraceae bacterium]
MEFCNGNQFFAFVTVTYKDIRLVGTPPESIGKFGAKTRTIKVWPNTPEIFQFSGSCDPDNLPAAYSTSNKPYTPKHFLPVSMDGVAGKETSIWSLDFPEGTTEYLTEEGSSLGP